MCVSILYFDAYLSTLWNLVIAGDNKKSSAVSDDIFHVRILFIRGITDDG